MSYSSLPTPWKKKGQHINMHNEGETENLVGVLGGTHSGTPSALSTNTQKGLLVAEIQEKPPAKNWREKLRIQQQNQ